MTDTLHAYQLPNSHLPGSILLSRYICKQSSVMETILSSLFSDEPRTDYYCGDTFLANGSRCDVLYQSQSSVPVIVQIQKKVTPSWLRTTLARCCFVMGDDNNLPCLVIFSIEPLPRDVKALCRVSPSAPYVYDLDMPLFAHQIQIFCPDLVDRYLDATNSLTLPPIVILSSFFSLQHPSALTSTVFSKHPFYEALYRHAVRFCQHLAIELEPLQYRAPTSTVTTAHKSSLLSQRRLPLSLLGSSQPYSLRQPRLRSNATSQRSSSVPSSSLAPPSVTRQSVAAASSTPPLAVTRASLSTLGNKKDKHRLQPHHAIHRDDTGRDDDDEISITHVDQHDLEVIRDYCQEQFDLGKTWQNIFNEGYGKYFAYKNKDSLKRSVRRYLKVGPPVATRMDRRNME